MRAARMGMGGPMHRPRAGAIGGGGSGPGSFSAATWKIISRMATPGGFTTASGFRWLDKDGNTIPTVGAAHTGSAAQSGAPADLFDGNAGTFFQSAVVVDWFLQTVFPGAVAVAGIGWTPLAGFPDRCTMFADVYYNAGAGDVYAFSFVPDTAWTNAEKTALDPGDGAMVDWIIANPGTGGFSASGAWFQAELETRLVAGGADQSTGQTGIASANVAAAGWPLANLIDNNLANFVGPGAVRAYDWMGVRHGAAKDIKQVAVTSRAGFTNQAMLSAVVLSGAAAGFRRRASVTGLTWPADPTTNLIAVP